MKKWMSNHIVFCFIVLSILFAIAVHIAFSCSAPCECLRAKWEAGDILTYVSTVSLGLLAVWQNKKFKEENDKSQERLENLSKKANELSVVSKIIEYESNSISDLKAKIQAFIDACNTESILDDLSDVANQPNDFMKLYVKIMMDKRSKQIKLCGLELLSVLNRFHEEQSVIKLIEQIKLYSNCSLELVKATREGAPIDDIAPTKISAEKDFIIAFSDFRSNREKLLDSIIYGNLTLEQIKALFHIKLKEEDNPNGQNENGVR